MRDYLADTRNFVKRNPPPGVNAANGHVRGLLLSPGMVAYALMPDGSDLRGTNTNAAHLYFAYNHLHWAIRQSFQNNENHCSDWMNINVIFQNSAILASIANIINDIIGVVGGDKEAEGALAQHLRDLVNNVQTNGSVTGGCHLNGHIATFISSNADSTINGVEQYINQIGGIQDSHTNILIDIIMELCRKFKTLPTDHPVWLTAEWQIKFLAAIEAALYATEK